ncbi:hypothetical protein, partial [Streptomyces sp. NPDC001851]|uniref:hypothetical protein n=1 Tax=Streptomyces sp. NPDC001851 TaxID=3154529 RepID=UPI00332314B8
SGSIRSHIASVITNRTDTSDQLTNPSKRHALGVTGKACELRAFFRGGSFQPDQLIGTSATSMDLKRRV